MERLVRTIRFMDLCLAYARFGGGLVFRDEAAVYGAIRPLGADAFQHLLPQQYRQTMPVGGYGKTAGTAGFGRLPRRPLQNILRCRGQKRKMVRHYGFRRRLRLCGRLRVPCVPKLGRLPRRLPLCRRTPAPVSESGFGDALGQPDARKQPLPCLRCRFFSKNSTVCCTNSHPKNKPFT